MTYDTGRIRTTGRALRGDGGALVHAFAACRRGAVVIRSKEPAACWASGDAVAVATVAEYAGPHAPGCSPPGLFRLSVNCNRTPAVAYQLRSPEVRRRLGLGADTQLCQSPRLELTAAPGELPAFAHWLSWWLDGHAAGETRPPAPPSRLIAWGWNDSGADCKPDFTRLGPSWRDCEYLWTPAAVAAFESRYLGV